MIIFKSLEIKTPRPKFDQGPRHVHGLAAMAKSTLNRYIHLYFGF
jgi:hypothetical protein